MYRIIVCGSRTFHDCGDLVDALLEHLVISWEGNPDIVTIIQGECPTGPDAAAKAWVLSDPPNVHIAGIDLDLEGFSANWERYGKAAGPRRNQEMLRSRVDQVVAFVDKPLAESRGTHDMVTRARKAGIPTMVIEVT